MMHSPLFQLLYVSSATMPFSPADLLCLLQQSRASNQRAGVTGLLLYRGGNFMQLLEGPEIAVRTVFERVQKDSRHRGIITLLEEPASQREFADWSMGFRDLTSPDATPVPGYNDFMNLPLTDSGLLADSTRAHRLLRSFRCYM
jgi:hypothetical protein